MSNWDRFADSFLNARVAAQYLPKIIEGFGLTVLLALCVIAAGLIAGIGGVTLTFGDDFELGGIALGTILVIVFFHMVKGRGGDGAGTVTRNLSHPDYDEGVEEVILATNPTVEGEATAHYIAQLLGNKGLVASRIAHGVPLGGELELVDGGTLAHSFAGRKPIAL